MSHIITNQQADPMALLLSDGTTVNLLGSGQVTVDHAVDKIRYHDLQYKRFGDWVVGEDVSLKASYYGGQNIHLTTPQQFEVVYQYSRAER